MSDQQEMAVLPVDRVENPVPCEMAPATEDSTFAAADPSPAAEDLRRLEGIDAELAGVDAALRRLDEGTYGTCEVCGVALTPDAIERDPLAVRCPGHES